MKLSQLALLGSTALIILGAGVAAADAPGVVASATGGYQVTYGANEAYRTIEFTAIRDARNNTRGQVVLFNHTTGTKLQWIVTCLHVEGNVATMSGIVSRDRLDVVSETFPYFFLQVVDNGEGDQAVDVVSPLYSSPVDQGCDFGFPFASIPAEGGNIQVK